MDCFYLFGNRNRSYSGVLCPVVDKESLGEPERGELSQEIGTRFFCELSDSFPKSGSHCKRLGFPADYFRFWGKILYALSPESENSFYSFVGDYVRFYLLNIRG